MNEAIGSQVSFVPHAGLLYRLEGIDWYGSELERWIIRKALILHQRCGQRWLYPGLVFLMIYLRKLTLTQTPKKLF